MHGLFLDSPQSLGEGLPGARTQKLQGKGYYLAATQDSEQVISGRWNLLLEVGSSIRFMIPKGKSWKL